MTLNNNIFGLMEEYKVLIESIHMDYSSNDINYRNLCAFLEEYKKTRIKHRDELVDGCSYRCWNDDIYLGELVWNAPLKTFQKKDWCYGGMKPETYSANEYHLIQ